MTTDAELLDRLRLRPVGVWSTIELAPTGCRLVICPDGRGIVTDYSGLAKEVVHFEWRLDPNGAFEVRRADGVDEPETDSGYLDWHPSPYRLTSSPTPYTKRIVPAIGFECGLLHSKTYLTSILHDPILFDGEPTPTPGDSDRDTK